MVHLENKAVLFLLCSYFFINSQKITQTSILFLLCAFIIGCLFSYWEGSKKRILFLTGLVCLLTLCFPAFGFYLPVFFYDIVQAKDYFLLIPAGIGLIRFCPAFLSSAFVLVLLMMLSAILSYAFSRISDYKENLHHILDTSKEHAIMMHERNQALIEKQNADIHAATLSERNRIAREIHDNVGHMLTRSLLQVGALKVIAGDDALDEPLTELQNTLNTAMTNVRTSVHDLHDDAIDLESTLHEIIDGVNTTKISLEYDVEGTLPNPIKYAFIAIVKEAVNNIQKHSNAKNASIRVCMHPGFYLLSIADNGTKISTADSRGIGLSNMEERVRALNGVIRFDTENGFKITIIIRR